MTLPYIAKTQAEKEEIQKKVVENSRDPRYKTYPDTFETPEEWWRIVYEWWDELILILEKFLPMNEPFSDEKGMIVAPILRNHIFELKQAKNANLAYMFDLAWAKAPDSGWIHSIKGWDVLCDLCSDMYVLMEKED